MIILEFLFKFHKNIASIIITYVLYTLILGWKAASLIVFGIGFHECCHLYAAKRLQMKTSGFFLIPFIGGIAIVNGEYKSYKDHAIVALAGPIGGALSAFVFYIAWLVSKNNFIGAATYWLAIVNLFNLIPLSLTDGGQVAETIIYSFSRVFGAFYKLLTTMIIIFYLWKINPLLSIFVLTLSASIVPELFDNFYYLKGKRYLCSDSYLNPPKSHTIASAMTTLIVWIANGSALYWIVRSVKEFSNLKLLFS